MKLENNNKYHLSLRILHWLMAILLIAMIGEGWFMIKLKSGLPLKKELFNLHRSFGILILVLFFIRSYIRFSTYIPPLPSNISKFNNLASSIGHKLLYFFMLIAPLTGIFATSFAGYKIPFFSFTLPKFIEKNSELSMLFHEIHAIIPYIFSALIIVHVGAALKHQFLNKIKLLQRIW
ncbi:MAG: cytochrome b [Alphaproteobacteria bacterium]|jgi:cytochrome b561|nr:cytochrome b [Alphaproteobacteria bacterium]OJV12565.1 MAG: hypothetical protein BGO27_03475 [Alphaproteobacteria bacterium 33-17]